MKSIQTFFDRLAPYAHLVLRCGIGFVFMWFGWSALVNTEMWIGLVPEWTAAFGSASTLVIIHGLAEIILGFILCTGYWTRTAAVLLALNLLHTTFVILPWGPVAVRDVGLSLATLSLGFFKRN